eukprot:GHVH01010851.1.p1 GENE.GHVH01010851.1~~GHVH01010851.1.p1  ORF type:complete len:766 (+),score=120.24 GHVH01010851.1:176-2473(+)
MTPSDPLSIPTPERKERTLVRSIIRSRTQSVLGIIGLVLSIFFASSFLGLFSSGTTPAPPHSKMTSTTTKDNPLYSVFKVQGDGTSRVADLPRFAQISGEHVEAAITHYIEKAKVDFRELEDKADSVTMRELIDGLNAFRDDLDVQWGAVKHLSSVKSNDALRAAIDTVEPEITKLALMASQSEPIHKALLRCLPDAKTDAERRVIEIDILEQKLKGIGLSGEKAERFNVLSTELSALSTKYANNVIDATKEWNRLITDKAELKGLPDRVMEILSEKALKEGHAGATPENGPWMLTVDHNSYMPVVQFLENRQLRKELYHAKLTVAGPSDLVHGNADVIKEILVARKELAQILGFNNHAEVSCAKKMATPEEAMNLMTSVKDKSLKLAKAELVELQKYASDHGFVGDLTHWDIAFWSEKMKLELYDYNEEGLRPYFKFENVLEGLFSLLKRLFKIDIRPFEIPAVAKWDDHVVMFEILKDDVTQAYFIIDPYVRPGEKNGGAWMNEVCGRNGLLGDRLPVANIVLNNSPPTPTKPSLLDWREVETVFHEMGHALQHMLTQVQEAGVAGIRGVEWDVVELPSQFMENWVYEYDLISTFAKHYETGEVLPRELFDKVERAKNYRAATFLVRQLKFGMLDFALHSTFDPLDSTKTIFDLNDEITKQVDVLPPYESDHFLCTFSHIFAGGYSAGYFSYMWALVMSADAFAAFEEAGLHDEENIEMLGSKFRETVLALGGSQHPADVYKLYRGKGATVDALLRHKGLIVE